MASYQGPATLIVDLHQLDLELSARSTTNPQGLVSWRGRMRAPRIPIDFLNATNGTLRIEDRDAEVIIRAVRAVAGGVVTLELTGSGEPPF